MNTCCYAHVHSVRLTNGCNIPRANGVSAGQGSAQYTHSGLSCFLLPSVYLEWISMVQDKISSFFLWPSQTCSIPQTGHITHSSTPDLQHPANRTHNPQLYTRPATSSKPDTQPTALHQTCNIPQTGHTTHSSTPDRQLENQSTKYHRQQPPV